MLENPKIIDAYVKILNKKHPTFFYDSIMEIKNNESKANEEQKLRENDNLKSKKRKSLQEEFKKNEFKNMLNPTTIGTTATINILSSNYNYLKRNSKIKNEYFNLKKNNQSSTTKESNLLSINLTESLKSAQTMKLLTSSKRTFLETMTRIIKPSYRTAESNSTPNIFTTIRKLLIGKPSTSTESSKQILERFFKSKNKTYEH